MNAKEVKLCRVQHFMLSAAYLPCPRKVKFSVSAFHSNQSSENQAG